MAVTYKLIDKSILGSTTASVTFSSIPSTFTDLKIIISARGTTSSNTESLRILPNGSTTSLSVRQIQGTGSGTYSATDTYWYVGEMPAATALTSTFGSSEITIPNYLSSNYKSAISDNTQENNTTTAYTNINTFLWSNTAAITSFTIQPNSNSFAAGSSFYLYGIKNS
jgi:hypothetical protein